jgi:hypothetical protein
VSSASASIDRRDGRVEIESISFDIYVDSNAQGEDWGTDQQLPKRSIPLIMPQNDSNGASNQRNCKAGGFSYTE